MSPEGQKSKCRVDISQRKQIKFLLRLKCNLSLHSDTLLPLKNMSHIELKFENVTATLIICFGKARRNGGKRANPSLQYSAML